MKGKKSKTRIRCIIFKLVKRIKKTQSNIRQKRRKTGKKGYGKYSKHDHIYINKRLIC